MPVPLNSATPTRRLVAELLVIVLVAALLVSAYRIDREWISRHVTLLNLWPERDSGAWSARGRGLLVLLAGMVALCLRPLLIFIAPKVSLARMMSWTPPVLLAIAASVVTVEAFLRWREAQAQRQTRWEQNGAPHPRYGWTWRPSRTSTEKVAGRDILWAVDREGTRVRSQDEEPDPALPTILFTGESVAAGWGLDYAETYPALIAARRGVQCVNLAVHRYGSDQAYLRLTDAMPRFQRLVATVTLFQPVQLGRNLQDHKPRLILGPTGELEFRPAATDFLSRLRIRRLLWNYLPYLGDQAIDRTLAVTSAILRETAIRTRARGAIPLFVVPSEGPQRPFDEHAEAWILRALFVQQNLPFILVDTPPDLLLSGEHHPAPGGDEKIAAAIDAALAAQSPGRGSTPTAR